MIGEERMAGSIDQVDGFIDFQDPSDGDVINEKWDAQITSVCTQVNDIVDMMENKGIPIRL
jgi:COP9 signalosome complex subunit 4